MYCFDKCKFTLKNHESENYNIFPIYLMKIVHYKLQSKTQLGDIKTNGKLQRSEHHDTNWTFIFILEKNLWKESITYHYFKYCTFVTDDIPWRCLSWTATIFWHPGAWRYCSLRRSICAAISIRFGCSDWCKEGSVGFLQGIKPQKTFKTIFAHLKFKPLIMSIKSGSHYFHELRFFNTKPSTNCNLFSIKQHFTFKKR